MNRKQRRAAPSKPGQRTSRTTSDPAGQLFAEAVRCQQHNKLDDAARLYKRLLLLKPDHAKASNNLGRRACRRKASCAKLPRALRSALALMPQLFEQFSGVFDTLVAVLPPIGEAMRRADAAWPTGCRWINCFGSAGLAAICDDPLLLCMLQSAPARNLALELRAHVAARRAARRSGCGPDSDDDELDILLRAREAVLHQRICFRHRRRTKTRNSRRLAARRERSDCIGRCDFADAIAALAMYLPLHALPDAASLLGRTGRRRSTPCSPNKLREPMQERALRPTIPRLTPIEDDVSLRVRSNTRKIPIRAGCMPPAASTPLALDAHLRDMFPAVGFHAARQNRRRSIFLSPAAAPAGKPLNVAQGYTGRARARRRPQLEQLVLRQTQHAGRACRRASNTRKPTSSSSASIERSFDVIDASGVLHHMADPLAGWRILLALLRPGGLMHLGFYSELGRRDVVAARAFIAERGYTATSAATSAAAGRICCRRRPRGVSRFNDFFSTERMPRSAISRAGKPHDAFRPSRRSSPSTD